jgi:hypothetical protein
MNQNLLQEEVLKMNLIYAVHLYIQKGGFDKSNSYKEIKSLREKSVRYRI